MDAERGFQVALLAVTVSLLFLLFRPYVTAILAAVLLAYLLDTPYDLLAPRLGDRLAALAVIAGTVLAVLVPFVLVITVVIEGVDDLLGRIGDPDGPTSVEELQALLDSVFASDLEDVSSLVELLQRGEVVDLARTAIDTFGGLSAALIHLTILLFVLYYLLKDGDRFVAWLGEVVPLSPDIQADLYESADKLLYAVVIGNFAVAVADGTLVALALWVVGFPDILFWVFVCIFLALIPLVGTMLVWVPASVYLVLVGDVVAGGFLFLYGFLVVGTVDNLLRPFVGAPEVGLEPGIFVIGVLTGLSLFGVMGVFFGPILLVMSKVVIETLGSELQQSA
jgi:predicted PurR-regulated permease PerM